MDESSKLKRGQYGGFSDARTWRIPLNRGSPTHLVYRKVLRLCTLGSRQIESLAEDLIPRIVCEGVNELTAQEHRGNISQPLSWLRLWAMAAELQSLKLQVHRCNNEEVKIH